MTLETAICDDSIQEGECLEAQLGSYCRERKISYNIDRFVSGKELQQKMQDKHYDLIFLDIELVNESGVEIGKFIREKLKDYTTEIIYISSHTQYAMELFQVQPLDFLVKPLAEKEFVRVMECFQKRYALKKKCFQFKNRKQVHSVPLEEILYFESSLKKIKIHLSEGEEEFYGKLADVIAKLEAYDFLRIHKSFLVNFAYVRRYENGMMVMNDDTSLNISKAYRSEVHQKILEIEMRER